MISSEWPASWSRRSAFSSRATSSKCRPVVGSSHRNSVPQRALPPFLPWPLPPSFAPLMPPLPPPFLPFAPAAPLRAVLPPLPVVAASARKAASFSRWASPPDSVGTGWPSFR